MEDQKGNMASHSRKGHSVNSRARRSSDLTMMIIGRAGKFRSFETSSRFLFLSLLFFALYILFSLLVFNGYFEQLRANKAQSGLLERLKQEVNDAKRALDQAEHHTALLEEALSDLGGDQKNPAEHIFPDKEKPVIQSRSVEEAQKKSVEMLEETKEPGAQIKER